MLLQLPLFRRGGAAYLNQRIPSRKDCSMPLPRHKQCPNETAASTCPALAAFLSHFTADGMSAIPVPKPSRRNKAHINCAATIFALAAFFTYVRIRLAILPSSGFEFDWERFATEICCASMDGTAIPACSSRLSARVSAASAFPLLTASSKISFPACRFLGTPAVR